MIRWVGLFGVSGGGSNDAGSGRKTWLAANIEPTDSVVDLGGCGEMFHPWHDHVTALDDLSGFGPGHRIYAPVFHRGDVCALPFGDQAFDVAALTEVLEHVPTPVKALHEAGRVARRVLITTPYENRWSPPAPQFHISGHIRFATPDLLAAQLRKADLHGDMGLLEFGVWSFLVAVVAKTSNAPPWDRYAQHGPQIQEALDA